MASSEQSFADRLQRGRDLQAATLTFVPPFAPADQQLLPVNFLAFLDDLDLKNQAVNDAESDWKDFASARLEIVSDLKDRALRALSRVKSNSAWSRQLPAVKAAADALRGYRPSRKKSPPKDDGTPATRTKPKADQSFGDIKNLTDKLVSALKKVPNFDDSAPVGIDTTALALRSADLDASNKTVAAAEQDLKVARVERGAGYVAEGTGLRAQMKAIKEATRSQYGGSSPEYLQVRPIIV